MKKLFGITSIVLMLFACTNNRSHTVEGLLKEVIAGHDVAMPQMPKLERLQKECKAAMDSINKLSLTAQKESFAYKTKLDSALNELNYAEMAMSKWMDEFGYDSLKNNEPERIKYLQSEKTKVNKMKEAVLNSLSHAETALKNK
jgi:hypothetical protein